MSAHFPACFRPTALSGGGGVDDHHSTPSPPPATGNSSLTTSVYSTSLGLFSLTWSRHRLGRSLRLHLRLDSSSSADAAALSPSSPLSPAPFHLQLKPLLFWTKRGSRKLDRSRTHDRSVRVFWDLTKAKFGSGPEPESGFYFAVAVDGGVALLVGDAPRISGRPLKPQRPSQALIVRREHVYGNKIYTTRARIGGRNRAIAIDCDTSGDQDRLCFSVDGEIRLQVKPLKWKFRGNEKVEVGGAQIQVSWDVYNWVFKDASDGHAVFMFGLENQETGCCGCDEDEGSEVGEAGKAKMKTKKRDGVDLWAKASWGLGMEALEEERKAMKRKGFLKSARSSSSSSLSSAASSSGCSSSVMEWANAEEAEPNGLALGFSLLVYAWKS